MREPRKCSYCKKMNAKRRVNDNIILCSNCHRHVNLNKITDFIQAFGIFMKYDSNFGIFTEQGSLLVDIQYEEVKKIDKLRLEVLGFTPAYIRPDIFGTERYIS